MNVPSWLPWLIGYLISQYTWKTAGEVLFESFEDVSRAGTQVIVVYTEEDEPMTIQQSTTYFCL